MQNEFILGFSKAFSGSWSALHNPSVFNNLKKLVLPFIAVAGTLYAVAIGITIAFFPLVLWAPGLVYQIFLLIPFWSFNLSQKMTPKRFNQLFLDQLSTLDRTAARDIGNSIEAQETNENWLNDTWTDLRTSWHFTKWSLILSFCSFIPFGSIIAYFGQLYLIADKLGWQLMSVYTESSQHMNYDVIKEWMHERRWTLLGFTLPFVVLTSIPLIGPFFLALGQAAIANLFHDSLMPPKVDIRKPFLSQPAWASPK